METGGPLMLVIATTGLIEERKSLLLFPCCSPECPGLYFPPLFTLSSL